MSTSQKTVRFVGVLFIVQMLTAVISFSVILDPILYKPDFLTKLSDNSFWVIMAMLFDLICGASVFAIAVLLYPILKKHSERVALWYVGQRLTELISFMISGALLLTLLRMGFKIIDVNEVESSQIEAIAVYLRIARGNIQIISLLVYCFGAWSFFGLLFYARLVPRFISIWGIIGVSLLFAEILSNIFGTSIGGLLVMMPLGLNEIFLGGWLIVRGFNPRTISLKT